MTNVTSFYSLSVEKGLRGNIGKMTVVKKKDGTSFMNVLVFLTANGDGGKEVFSQAVNAHFTEEVFNELKKYGVSDYVRIYFNRVDLAKGKELLHISVKASRIEMLKKSGKNANSNLVSAHQVKNFAKRS